MAGRKKPPVVPSDEGTAGAPPEETTAPEEQAPEPAPARVKRRRPQWVTPTEPKG